jgi:hypothetical protein
VILREALRGGELSIMALCKMNKLPAGTLQQRSSHLKKWDKAWNSKVGSSSSRFCERVQTFCLSTLTFSWTPAAGRYSVFWYARPPRLWAMCNGAPASTVKGRPVLLKAPRGHAAGDGVFPLVSEFSPLVKVPLTSLR